MERKLDAECCEVCCAFRGTKEKSHRTSVIAYFPVYLKIHVHTDLVEMMTDHWEAFPLRRLRWNSGWRTPSSAATAKQQSRLSCAEPHSWDIPLRHLLWYMIGKDVLVWRGANGTVWRWDDSQGWRVNSSCLQTSALDYSIILVRLAAEGFRGRLLGVRFFWNRIFSKPR